MLIILYISLIFKYISRIQHSLNISVLIFSKISYELSNWLLVISLHCYKLRPTLKPTGPNVHV